MGLTQQILKTKRSIEELEEINKRILNADFNIEDMINYGIKELNDNDIEPLYVLRKYGLLHQYLTNTYNKQVGQYIPITKEDAKDLLFCLNDKIEHKKLGFLYDFELYNKLNEDILREVCDTILKDKSDKKYYYFSSL